jgi:hypothetical protein
MDLRLRNNIVAGPFSAEPFGLRLLCPALLSLLPRRSRWICALVAPRTKPNFLSAVMSIIFQRAVNSTNRSGLNVKS